jgi:predicted DNA-binding transcriptional regulator AlpA
MTKAKVPTDRLTLERDLLTLDDLIAITGWGKTKTYEDAKAGALPFPVLRNGRRYYFSRRAYEAWRDGETTTDSGNAA